MSKYRPDAGLSLSKGGARRSRAGFVLLSIEGAGAEHKSYVRQFASIDQYIFILHRHELVSLLRTTNQASV